LPVTGVLDTSAVIAILERRQIDVEAVPSRLVMTAITAAELEAGIHSASDITTRMTRLATYQTALRLQWLPVDREVTHRWAALRVAVGRARARVNINDLWIAAIAKANQMPVVTQDDDFDVLIPLGGPDVIHV